MRFGGSVMGPYAGADAFVAMARECGFRAVAFPLRYDAPLNEIDALVRALKDADILIAEVGAWRNNPLSPDKNEKKASLEDTKKQLELAEYIGAGCCVNVAGSHSGLWDGPSVDAFTPAVFNEVVETVQEIIDAVNPKKTGYSLETMPWMIPNSPDSYVALIKAINRPAFTGHLDTVNLVNSPERYYNNAALTQECFDKFGSSLRCIHVKDIILRTQLTVHLDECLVGQGGYDLGCLLRNAAKLPASASGQEIPLLVEHLKTQQEFKISVAYLNKLAGELGLA
ncbi:MAG: sugar phosphate isomerase/epimerase [Treponema sp.]|jgi:sugar phosphate isomerase/epimerase|nr:sugar phosphate isomerase/epimerase [Treponema sp.]